MIWRRAGGAFLCGILAGALLVLWVLCQLGVLAVETTLGTVSAVAPFVDGIAAIEHECCDCGLVHHVRFAVASDDGESFFLLMVWQRDEKETRKRRLHKWGPNWDSDQLHPRNREPFGIPTEP